MHTQVLIPTHAEVANAVGAAVGQVAEIVHLLIKPGVAGGYVVHAPWKREAFISLEEAEKYALDKAKEVVLERARRAEVVNPEVLVEKEEVVHKGSITDYLVNEQKAFHSFSTLSFWL